MSLQTRFWRLEKSDENEHGKAAVRCGFCIHGCLLHEGKSGVCGVRYGTGQELVSPYLGRFASIAIDPIEKKPLYHWRPGSFILSLGSLGCTMRCPFCQNHSIAHPSAAVALPRLSTIAMEDLVQAARDRNVQSIAYTYNEPTLQAEYILSAAPMLQEAGIATVLVSNGMYSAELLEEFSKCVDAANIDVKTFNAATYAKMGGSLDTVKTTVSYLWQKGVHVEVTTLVVPGISDSEDEFDALIAWAASISPELPLHISRYRPAHKFTAPPTDIDLLKRFAAHAQTRLNHVHIGNVPGMR